MKIWILVCIYPFFACAAEAIEAPVRARTPVRIPDIPGYQILKCDFHIHTVFSDGTVWPDVRSEEAWREGFDAIAITDHIEYQPHKNDLPTKHNRSHEIAKSLGDALDIIVIRGSEITRKMPPGHLNAIFLEDAARLDTENWRDAVNEAHHQGAFIFWNHPGWTGQQADGVSKWYPEHSDLVSQGIMQGIEVVNGRSYYPEAHAWCLEKNLTMLSNSDIHQPLLMDYHVHTGDHRPMTLVFVRERSLKGIKEALADRRTAVYSANQLIGRERFLKPIFERSVRVLNPDIRIKGRQRVLVQIHNESDLDYKLEEIKGSPGLTLPKTLNLPAGKTVLLTVRGKSKQEPGEHSTPLSFKVKNLLIGPDQPLSAELPLTVHVPEP